MGTDFESEYRLRLERIRTAAEGAGLGAVILTPGDDLLYLLGLPLHSHERLTALVLPSEPSSDPVLVVPALELTDAVRDAARRIGAQVRTFVDSDMPHLTVATLLEGTAGAVGVSADMPARHLVPITGECALRDVGPVTLAGIAVDGVRAIKTTLEVEALAEAASRIDAVHDRMGEFLVVGRTEAEAAELVAAAITEEGLTHAEFVIVASGPNGADPHHTPSERVLADGDVVVVDIGGPHADGYHSDCTRTYVMGEPSAEAARAYEVLQEAQRRARAEVRPTVTGRHVDAAARDHLAEAGYGDYFVHRTGHGIGLGLHEWPSIGGGDGVELEVGMCFSVEPGIYVPGRFGMRLEDIVVVTDEGGLELNRCDRSLRSL